MKVDYRPNIQTFTASTKTNKTKSALSNNKTKPNHSSVASGEHQGGGFFDRVRNWAGDRLNRLNISTPQAKTALPQTELAKTKGEEPISSKMLESYIQLQEDCIELRTLNILLLNTQLSTLPEGAIRDYAEVEKRFLEREQAHQERYESSQQQLEASQEDVIGLRGQKIQLQNRIAELLYQQRFLPERSAKVSLDVSDFVQEVGGIIYAALIEESISEEAYIRINQGVMRAMGEFNIKFINRHLDNGNENNGNGNENGNPPEDFN